MTQRRCSRHHQSCHRWSALQPPPWPDAAQLSLQRQGRQGVASIVVSVARVASPTVIRQFPASVAEARSVSDAAECLCAVWYCVYRIVIVLCACFVIDKLCPHAPRLRECRLWHLWPCDFGTVGGGPHRGQDLTVQWVAQQKHMYTHLTIGDATRALSVRSPPRSS